MPIKNIIFDLGGVIIDIDYQRTTDAFGKLGILNFDQVYSQSKQDNFFDDYETGKIDTVTFRRTLKTKLNTNISDDQLDAAWNAMLGDLPIERLHLIETLRSQYNVLLLSNTNEIHLQEVFAICQRQNGFNTFVNYFHKEYYSYQYGKRKPHPDTFTSILSANGFEADETLFVEDSIQHIQGAKQAGLHVLHITNGLSIFNVTEHLIQLEGPPPCRNTLACY